MAKIFQNAKLNEQLAQLLEEGAKISAETEKMREMISEMEAEILSKSYQLSHITEAVRIQYACLKVVKSSIYPIFV